jgi:hypothetical protein
MFWRSSRRGKGRSLDRGAPRWIVAVGDGAGGGTRLRVIAMAILVARANFGEEAADAMCRFLLQRRPL